MQLQKTLILIIFASIISHVSFGVDFAGGDGTSENPYQIANATHLNNLRNYLNITGICFIQTADIDLGVSPWNEGSGWVPVGTGRNSDTQFRGSYNGNGHAVRNMIINRPDAEYIGLFGSVLEGYIENLSVLGCSVKGLNFAGALAGWNENTPITNCSSSGIVGVSGTTSDVGGLIGYNYSYGVPTGTYVVSDCFSLCQVSGAYNVGGLIGYSMYTATRNCFATGQVYGSGIQIGGLVGGNFNCDLTDCYATGDVSGQNNDIGGLVGRNERCSVTGCFSTGEVKSNYRAGGLVGWSYESRISESFSNGNIVGKYQAGGLIGLSELSTISDCYATGSVSGAESDAGGFVGKVFLTSHILRCFSTGCVNDGMIIAKTGGFIGTLDNSTVEVCYWDSETSKQNMSAGQGDGAAMPVNTEGMTYPYNETTYNSWNFNTIWVNDTDGRRNFGYPYLKNNAPDITPGAVKWKVHLGSSVGMSSPALGSDNTIYLATSDNLCAVSPDGRILWSFPSQTMFTKSSPAIGKDGTIYIGSFDQILYAVNPDGTKKWEYLTNGWITASPAVDDEDNVFFGCLDHYFYALNRAGELLWKLDLGTPIYNSSPAIGIDGTIYCGGQNGKLYALNPDGTKKWECAAGNSISSSVAIGADGTLYVTTEDNKLLAVSSDGEVKWTFIEVENWPNSPVVGEDGTIYISCLKGEIIAVNPDGTKKWELANDGKWSDSSPAIGKNGVIYYGSTYDRIYAVNPEGSKRWTCYVIGEVDCSPTITDDCILYAGSGRGYLYAIYTDSSGLAQSSWPKFRCNVKNTGVQKKQEKMRLQNFLAEYSYTKNRLSWNNPLLSKFGGVMIRFSSNDYPSVRTEGTLLLKTDGIPGESCVHEHKGIKTNTPYFYSAWCYDSGECEYFEPAGTFCFTGVVTRKILDEQIKDAKSGSKSHIGEYTESYFK